MGRKRWMFWMIILAPVMGFSQDYYSFPARLRFVTDALDAGKFEVGIREAEDLLEEYQGRSSDSLHYLAGKGHWLLKEQGFAESHFKQVSSHFSGSRYCKGWLTWNAWKQQEAAALADGLTQLDQAQDNFREFGNLIRCDRLLYGEDTAGYRSFRAEWKAKDLYVRQALMKMDAAVVDFGKEKKKKPATAGLLAAVIPGAGKAYLGKWPSAGMTLLGMGAIGIQAYEGYHKGGVKSPQFIAFSGLFLLLYANNIVGSVTQTKSYNIQLVSDFRHTVGLQVDICFERFLAP